MDKICIGFFCFLKFLFSITPNFIKKGFAKLIAKIAYILDKRHRKVAFANLNLCYENTLSTEEKIKIVKNTYLNFAFFIIDFIENQNTTQEKILKKVRFKNDEIFDNAIKANRPIFIMGAHYGNWEVYVLALAARFGSGYIVGRALDSKIANIILTKNRTQFDVKLIDKMAGARSILKALKENTMIGVLVDQNVNQNEGIEVSFFGKKALHTPSISILAKKTNALIFPTFIHKTDDFNHEIEFFQPIEPKYFSIEELTQMQADITEKVIRRKPDEYFWFHRRFKAFYKDAYEA